MQGLMILCFPKEGIPFINNLENILSCSTCVRKIQFNDNPPHPEIWIHYFLRMVELYSNKVCAISKTSENSDLAGSISYLNQKDKELLKILIKKHLYEFTPIPTQNCETLKKSKSFYKSLSLAYNKYIHAKKQGEWLCIPI